MSEIVETTQQKQKQSPVIQLQFRSLGVDLRELVGTIPLEEIVELSKKYCKIVSTPTPSEHLEGENDWPTASEPITADSAGNLPSRKDRVEVMAQRVANRQRPFHPHDCMMREPEYSRPPLLSVPMARLSTRRTARKRD